MKRIKSFIKYLVRIIVPSNLLSEIYRLFQLKKSHEFIELISNYCGGFENKIILEVGAGKHGGLIQLISNKYNVKEAVGIDILAEDRTFSNTCRTEFGDIRKTNFPENQFDIVISSSAFEHIQNFDLALNEMYRILKKDGLLFSHFGPIWSTSYGHHMGFTYKGRLYNYRNLILPPYCHLLMNPDELFEYLRKKYSEELCRNIVNNIYNSKYQNKLLFEDYERLIKQSKFKILFFKGYDNPDLSKLYKTKNFSRIIDQLINKYIDKSNFLYDGITVLLRK